MNHHWKWLTLFFLLAALGGYWVARTAAPDRQPTAVPPRDIPSHMRATAHEPMPEFRSGDRPPAAQRDHDALDADAVPNQRVIAFSSQDALEAFLARMGDGIRVIGRLDALNALRVSFRDPADLASALDGDEELSMIFPVEIPMPGNVGAGPGAVELGNGLLRWLGIDGMDPAGTGVRIAILDTGIFAHTSFDGKLTHFNLIERSPEATELNGHGTAVASTISGNNRLTPGVAPLAELLDFRIATDFGSSNSWLLAEGIIAATDAGAHFINVSLGSNHDSALVRNAIAYARESGVVIIAAAGNQGSDRVSFPAANEGVIAVGAVDATGKHVAFSNSGNIDVAAPGYRINTAWPGDAAANVSGTSFSAPIVTGSLAWIMSTQNVGPQQAVTLMNQYLNDAGPAGPDPAHGGGLPALDRIANRNTPGIHDAAVASHHIIPPSPGSPAPMLEVVVQNRGTEPLVNTSVTINHPGGTTTANITSLPPNAVHPVRVPIPISQYQKGDPLTFDSRVSINQGISDANPSNNRRIDVHLPEMDR